VVAKRGSAPLAGGSGGAWAIEELIGGAVEVEQRIAASATTVFSFLTDPAKFVRWMGIEARLDPRPGGTFRLDVDGEHIATGQYEVVDPPHRVVLSWGWEGSPEVPPGSTTVEITLTPDGEGTLLRLRHIGLPSEEQRASHRDGWKGYLAQLAAASG
jgi:uncharacterized protein YndB with AHSA1/START domain